MEDDKPFACPSSDCGMRFANEAHLFVHKKKHEMSLTLTPSTSLKNPFVDQTPTPTRFLTALENELFQEFTDNPFEATFRKANSMGTNTTQITIPEASTLISSLPESDVLNTPSITLTADVENAVSTRRHRAHSNEHVLDVSDDTLPFTPNTHISSTTHLGQLAHNNNENSTAGAVNSNTAVQIVSSAHSDISTSANTCDGGKSDTIRTSGVQTPVITSVGLPGSVKSSITSVPMAVVVTRAVTSSVSALSTSVRPISVVTEAPSPAKVVDIAQPVLSSLPVSSVVQLVIKLPDGQTMPFQIPVSIAPAPSANTQSFKVSSNPISTKTSTAHSLTKMKLKEVLTLSQKSTNGVNGNISSRNGLEVGVANSYPSFIAPCQNSSDTASLNGSPPSSPQTTHRSGSVGRRRRDSEGDPDEKRRKSLERNRAAATRCRQKRKQWIVALEKKAEELARTNVHLQNEVSLLRGEVSQLKSMLLAHKDCPITLQQKASNFCEVTRLHTVPIHPKRSQSPATQPADGMRITTVPLQVEVMDMEVHSSGNSYILEVSDASSVSEPRTPAQGFHETF